MSGLKFDAGEIARQLLAEARDELRDTWGELRDSGVTTEVAEGARDYGELLANSLVGADVDQELAHARARVLNWSWIGADRVRARWQGFLDATFERLGRAAAKFAKGLAG